MDKRNSFLGTQIKSIRCESGLSQKRFGNKIGVSSKAVSSYETGKCMPSLKVLKTISEVYETEFTIPYPKKLEDIKENLKEVKEIVRDITEKLSYLLEY
ncbi:hypothetical protein A3H26_00320 [candidate division WWE3 bacterium RIFCSPLOWO2_12_FULL_36_10]|uniref:HTH cro/C1-type domain-containing protein n=1 Tax=candidate division WWE3 bacterium RIFCSPLOWO2_12_FULL_36_10 TaxID=1802630 RepID=A0A1F4VGP0_UNCKA|nr:MAG: hypothetical protein A3H26_00320 [candidate division WWE3 bacterium RIFCSPLOWO2_12_FULL_36_10]